MKLAPISEMWDQYPLGLPGGVGTLIGGAVGDHVANDKWETCCIRTSRALNYSARPIGNYSGMANKYLGPNATVRASKGGDGKWYIYSCYDMRVYLEHRFGHPKRFGAFDAGKLAGTQGVIMFGFRHCDLWDGLEVRYNTNFTDGTKTVSEVLVWEAPL